jgi:plasmid replication initiation protein
MGEVAIRVEATAEHGMATIWDADVAIWAASQLVVARDKGLRRSRLMAATHTKSSPSSAAALRCATITASRRRSTGCSRPRSQRLCANRRMHRFSWVNEWKERAADGHGRPLGIELIIPDWLYAAVLNDALVLTIDRSYFGLTGGLERWLYRIVRKHAGRQPGGWCFAR